MNVPAAPSGALPQLGVIAGAFAVGTVIALAAGAANLGVALGVGQITLALAVVWVLLRG